MYRATLRSASRPAVQSFRSAAARTAPRRFASTASPADKPRSWKSSLARWGLAVAGVYYYNVNSTFADDLSSSLTPPPYTDRELPTVESMVEKRRKESRTEKQVEKPVVEKVKEEEKQPPKAETSVATETQKLPEAQEQSAITPTVAQPAALEEEASQDGAFNPETGEINWDCPCLGGMAHGPCGEQFKTAFSCFVYSTEEPKGMDCIEKFQGMQECFREYPEIYGSELQDDAESDDVDAAAAAAAESAPATRVVAEEPVQSLQPVVEPTKVSEPPMAEFQTLREDHFSEKSRKPQSEKLVVDQKVESTTTPWTDTTAANKAVKEDEEK